MTNLYPDDDPRQRELGNGVARLFNLDFNVDSKLEIRVSVDGVLQTLDTDYTATVDEQGDWAITLGTAPIEGSSIVIWRETSPERGVEYTPQRSITADTLNQDSNQLIRLVQEILERQKRQLSIATDHITAPSPIPAGTNLANRYVVFDDNGNLSVSDSTTAGQEIAEGAITVEKLADEIVRRLVPTGGQRGQFLIVGENGQVSFAGLPDHDHDIDEAEVIGLITAQVHDWARENLPIPRNLLQEADDTNAGTISAELYKAILEMMVNRIYSREYIIVDATFHTGRATGTIGEVVGYSAGTDGTLAQHPLYGRQISNPTFNVGRISTDVTPAQSDADTEHSKIVLASSRPAGSTQFYFGWEPDSENTTTRDAVIAGTRLCVLFQGAKVFDVDISSSAVLTIGGNTDRWVVQVPNMSSAFRNRANGSIFRVFIYRMADAGEATIDELTSGGIPVPPIRAVPDADAPSATQGITEAAVYSAIDAAQNTGPRGPKGDKGDDGEDGQDGRDGQDGEDGQDGRDGQDGERGPPGQDGQDGEDGERGPPGQDASLTDVMATAHTTAVRLRSGSAENLTPDGQNRIYATAANIASGAWWRDNTILHGWVQDEGANIPGLPSGQNYFLLTVKDAVGDMHQWAFPDTSNHHYERRWNYNVNPGSFDRVLRTLTGTAAPTNAIGTTGSIYVRTGGTAPLLYMKQGSSWTQLQTGGGVPIAGDQLAEETLLDNVITAGNAPGTSETDEIADLGNTFQLTRALDDQGADDAKTLYIELRVGNTATDRNGSWRAWSFKARKFRNETATSGGTAYNSIENTAFNLAFGGPTTQDAFERAALVKTSERTFGIIDTHNAVYITGMRVYLQPNSGIQGPPGQDGQDGTPGAAGTTDISHTENQVRILDTATLLDGAVLSTQSFTEATISGGTQADPIRGYRRAEFGTTTGGTALGDNLPIFMSKLTGRASDADTYISAAFWHDDEMNLAFGAGGGAGLAPHFHSDLRVGLVVNGNKVWDAAMSDATTSGAGGGDTRFVWTHGSDPFPSESGREFRVLFYRASAARGLKYLYEHVDRTYPEIATGLNALPVGSRIAYSSLDGLPTIPSEGGSGSGGGFTERELGLHVWAPNTGSSTATYHVAAANWQEYDFIRVIWDNNMQPAGDGVVVGPLIPHPSLTNTGAWAPEANIFAAPAIGDEEYIIQPLRGIVGGSSIYGIIAKAAVNGNISPDLLTLNITSSTSAPLRGIIYGIKFHSSFDHAHDGTLDAQEENDLRLIRQQIQKGGNIVVAKQGINAAAGTRNLNGTATDVVGVAISTDPAEIGSLYGEDLEGNSSLGVNLGDVTTATIGGQTEVLVKAVATDDTKLYIAVDSVANRQALQGNWVPYLHFYVLDGETGEKAIDITANNFDAVATANNATQDFWSINHGGTGLEAGKRYYVGWYVGSALIDFYTAQQLLDNGHFVLTDHSKQTIRFFKWHGSSTPPGKPVVVPRPPELFFAQSGWTGSVPAANRWNSPHTLGPKGANDHLWIMESPCEYNGATGNMQLSGDKWIRTRQDGSAEVDH